MAVSQRVFSVSFHLQKHARNHYAQTFRHNKKVENQDLVEEFMSVFHKTIQALFNRKTIIQQLLTQKKTQA